MKRIISSTMLVLLAFASPSLCGPESWPKPWLSSETLTIGPLNPYSDLYHATWDGGNGEKYAVDFLGTMETRLYSPVNGRIVCCNMYSETTVSTSCANGHGGYGNHIIIEPDGDAGNTFIMAHMSDASRQLPIFSKTGSSYRIDKGELVGFLGSTGNSTAPHLHFELRSRKKAERDSIKLFGITEAQFRNRASLIGSFIEESSEGGGTDSTVTPPSGGGITITTNSLPGWEVNKEGYKQRIYYEGGTATSARISIGTLPDGLNLTCVNGQVHIEGKPTKGGTFTFTVKIEAGSKSGEKSYTISISGGTVTPPSDPVIPQSNWELVGNTLTVNGCNFQQQGSGIDTYFIITGLPRGSVITLPEKWTVDTDGRAVTVSDSSKVSSLSDTYGVRIAGACTITINYDGITFTARQTQDTTWELVGNELVISCAGKTYRFPQLSSGSDNYFIVNGLPNGSVITLPEKWTVDTDGRAVTVSDSSKVSSLSDTYGVRIAGACTITINYDGITFTARYQDTEPVTPKVISWELVGTELVVQLDSGSVHRFQQQGSGTDTYFIVEGLPNGSIIQLHSNWTLDTGEGAVSVSDISKVSSIGIGAIRISGACSITVKYDGIQFTARVQQADNSTPSTSGVDTSESSPQPDSGTETVSIKNSSQLKNASYMKSYRLNLKLEGADEASWRIVYGDLPEGITLDQSTGKISGKPSEWDENPFEFIVRADTSSGSAQKAFTLLVKPVKPKIKGSLPKGQANDTKAYIGVLTATGSGPKEWDIENLPDGFDYEIDDDGDTCTITGYPDEEFKGRIRVTVTNAAGSTSKNVRLVIKPEPPQIDADDMPNGILGVYYETELASPGNPKWSWSGRVPPGLKLDKAMGIISGTPTLTGDFTFKVKAKNSSGTDYQEFTVSIREAKNYKPAPSDSSTDPKRNTNGGQVSNEPDNAEFDAIPARIALEYGSEVISVLGSRYFVVAVLSRDFTVEDDGQQDFEVNLDESVPSGLELHYFAQSTEPSDDDEIIDFFSISGEAIDGIVPEDHVIIAAPWFNEGIIYNPVLTVKAED